MASVTQSATQSLSTSRFWTRCFYIQRLFTLLSTFSDTDHFFVMYEAPYTSIAIETFQLRFCRVLGYSITEVCFSVTPPWNRILTSHSFLDSHHLNGCPSLEVPDAPCTKSCVAFASITKTPPTRCTVSSTLPRFTTNPRNSPI